MEAVEATAKRPRVYAPDGEVIPAEIVPPWAAAAGSAVRKASASASASGGKGDASDDKTVSTTDIENERNKHRLGVFQHSAIARSELQVIKDTLLEVKKGARLTLGGMQRQAPLKSASHQNRLALTRKSEQLTEISKKFRGLHALLSTKVRSSETFYGGLSRLQCCWKVKQSVTRGAITSDTTKMSGFCFDLACRQLDFGGDAVEIYKDTHGNLYVEADDGIPKQRSKELSETGAKEVHKLLRKIQEVRFRSFFAKALSRKVKAALAENPWDAAEQEAFVTWCVCGHTSPQKATKQYLFCLKARSMLMHMLESSTDNLTAMIGWGAALSIHGTQRRRVLDYLDLLAMQSASPAAVAGKSRLTIHYLDSDKPSTACVEIRMLRQSNPIKVTVDGADIHIADCNGEDTVQRATKERSSFTWFKQSIACAIDR